MNIVIYIAAVWFGGVLLAGGFLGVLVRGGVFRLVGELVPFSVSGADAAHVALRAILGIVCWPYHIVAALVAVRPFVTDDDIRDMARGLSRFQPVNAPRAEPPPADAEFLGMAEPYGEPFHFEPSPKCTEECQKLQDEWTTRYIAAFEKWEAERIAKWKEEHGAER